MQNQVRGDRDNPAVLAPERSGIQTAPLDVSKSIGARALDALASMASDDGVVSPAEYEAILQAAESLDRSNVSAFLALSALDRPKKSSDTLSQLRSVAATLAAPERARLLSIAWPLLELQGERALAFGERYAGALGLELSEQQRESLEFGPTPPMWKTVTAHSLRRLKGRDVIAKARECMRYTGDPSLSLAIADYLDGKHEVQVIEELTSQSRAHLCHRLQAFSSAIRTLEGDIAHRQSLLEMATELVTQIEQRVDIFLSRIELEKEEFDDEFEDLIHDAGNAFELEARDRMSSSDWQVARFWDRLAKGPFARELERRVDRVTRRHAERLRHFRQEAIHFQREYQIASGRLMARVHHSAFADLMPGLRKRTQVLSSVDGVADVAVGGSVIAGIGTGVAVYFFGTAAVLPLVAPAAPFVGAAFLIGALWKGMSDIEGRGAEELTQKRTAFEQVLRKQLEEVRSKLFAEYDSVRSDFVQAAEAVARPTLTEAQAQYDLVALQERVGQRVLQSAEKFATAA